MPRYYFHIHDGSDILDREGTELPGLEAARREAIHYAGLQISQNFQTLPAGGDWHLDVTDASGMVLFRLDFIVSEAPAARRAFGSPRR